MRFGSVIGVGPLSDREKERNREYSRSLNLPSAFEAKGSGPLAIIGGGPSIMDRVEELRAWPGARWAINGAMAWCRGRGVPATYISLDPEPTDIDDMRAGERAIVGTHCNREIFDALLARQAEVSTMDLADLVYCSTTASAAIFLAVLLGYSPVTLFGCESSYTDRTHAYAELYYGEPVAVPIHLMRVACNGGEFLTKPEFLFQAEYLAEALRRWPHLYRERSGGLLAAMVANPDYDIVAGSKALHESLATS